MSILGCLPNEVIEEIIDTSSIANQATIAQVSRVFNELTTRFLYNNIVLDHRTLLGCTKTLRANPVKAAAVRSLSLPETTSEIWLQIPQTPDDPLDPSEFQDPDLQPCIDREESQYHEFLLECTLPKLHTFSFNLSFVHYPLLVTSFLNRHCDLVSVTLHPNIQPTLSRPCEPIHLPRLQHFSAPSLYFPALSQSAQLRSAHISWGHLDKANIECPIAALAQSSKDTIQTLICSRNKWNIDLIDAISRHIPSIRSLSVQTGSGYVFRVGELGLRAIAVSLAELTSLEVFEYYSPDVVVARVEQDRAHVKTWGEACPTLKQCNLCEYALSLLPAVGLMTVLDGQTWAPKDGEWVTVK